MLEAVSLPEWPLFGLADDVRPALRDIVGLDRPAVLATLYRVVGGSPRPAGSQMLISPERLSGFMSGGCIEADIAAHAAHVADTGQAQHLVYGDGGPYPDIRLVCGGRVEILLERIGPDDPAIRRLLDLGDARRPALWVSDGETRRCWAVDEPAPALPSRLAQAAQDLAEAPDQRCVNADSLALGLRFPPLKRMIVVGGDPTAIAIASLASQSGFETWLVRSKGPATPPPLPGVGYDRRTPDIALPAIGLDAWTYVAVATHDFESDEAALVTALPSDAAYVGVLGARRRLPERLSRLTSLGVSSAALARLKAPIGLALGGKAPFEVAISVLAEVIAHKPDVALPATATVQRGHLFAGESVMTGQNP
jgi:xanthine dehydrogenase accessory factor